MFRVLSLNIDDPACLGNIKEGKLLFVPAKEIQTTAFPYTTVIIGQNGTGKSTLLSYIARIFEDLKYFDENQKRNSSSINFSYSISYVLDRKIYKVIQKATFRNLTGSKENPSGYRWHYHCFTKNTSENDVWDVINWTHIKLPEQIVAVSYLPMDRFRQKRNLPDDYYQYLGLRHRSNAASPQYFLNNTLPLLFNYIAQNNSINFLKDILSFMDVDKGYLGIQLEYRYKKFFFTKELTVDRFIELFENSRLFSKREGTSFAVDYYNRYIKGERRIIKKITTYLNVRAEQDKITVGEKSLLEFNLFDNFELFEELELILHLQKLDLLASATLLFKKGSTSPISTQELSSGEFHYLTTMIAIQASIKPNSLILIDEPDTSLHPNWQMKYVNNLKILFKKWNSNHIIMATHSHFIISDLQDISSEVIGLTGKTPNINAEVIDRNTYGWSAEEVLYKIFNIKTTRNYYLEYDLTLLVSIINTKRGNDIEFLELKRILFKLNNMKFSSEDPINVLIEKGNNYLKKVDVKH